MSLRDLYILREDRAVDARVRQQADSAFQELLDQGPAGLVTYAEKPGVIEVGSKHFDRPWNVRFAYLMMNRAQSAQVRPGSIKFMGAPVVPSGGEHARPPAGGEQSVIRLKFKSLAKWTAPLANEKNVIAIQWKRFVEQNYESLLRASYDTFVHEFVHFSDRERIPAGVAGREQSPTPFDRPTEYNAYSQEAINAILKSPQMEYIGSAQEFAEEVVNWMDQNFEIKKRASPDMIKRLQKRAATAYEHAIEGLS